MASVTLEHLTKTYPNGFVSVNDVSLHIEEGEFDILQTTDHAQDRRFAAAARSVKDNKLTVFYMKADVIYGDESVWVSFSQVL